MSNLADNRFARFFSESHYLDWKNHLYNYRLRKRAIVKNLGSARPERILEVGSGISPVVTCFDGTVYTDVSARALQSFKHDLPQGIFVVADGSHLPFRPGVFSHVVCSEVLEHVKNDQLVVLEMARLLKRSGGSLLLTVPHRKRYFASDDRFVGHLRRYELTEITRLLECGGLRLLKVKKVLGLLEKVTMLVAVWVYALFQKRGGAWDEASPQMGLGLKLLVLLFRWGNQIYMIFAWLDARIVPLAFSTVILIGCTRVDSSAK